MVFKVKTDQYLLLDYQKDHMLEQLNKFFLVSQIVHDNGNFPINLNKYHVNSFHVIESYITQGRV